jgi:hypothetical protein
MTRSIATLAFLTLASMSVVPRIHVRRLQHPPVPAEFVADGIPMPPPPPTSQWMVADGIPMPPPPQNSGALPLTV